MLKKSVKSTEIMLIIKVMAHQKKNIK